jgi:DNA-binding transcriptional LysR family regulator
MDDIDQLKLRRLDGGLLLVFRELLRTGRASEVAKRLGLSQPAISHALGRLRELFDDPLFVRRPHGLEPTRRAELLAPRIEALVALAGEVLAADEGFDPATSRRRFDFGAPEFVTALIGGELLNRLQASAPGVAFAVMHIDEEAAFAALRSGRVEFALGRFTAPRAGFSIEPLFEDEYCAVVRRGHPQVRGAMSERQWREIGHVYAWSGSETGPDAGVTGEGVAMRAAVPHWLTVMILVAASDAVATLPRRLATRHADRLGVQVLDLPVAPNRISVSVARRAGHRDPGLDWFVDQVRAAAVA